ncbi:YveK family protein [Kocuria sp. CH-021]|uniref:YveK family protein n=1 Tax=Kocuria sp. CH-021 TaxID=3406735 RepID=UPI003C754246
MEPVEHLIALQRSWRIVAICTILGIAAGLLAALLEAPSYRATTSVLLVPSATVGKDDLGSVNSFMNSQIHSYAALTDSPMVLDPVLTETGLSVSHRDLAKRVSAEVPVDTLVVEIHTSASDPAEAANLANSVARHLTDAVGEVAPVGDAGAPTVELETVGAAAPPEQPDSPNKRLRLAVGTAAGLLVGILVAVARHAVSLRRTEDENENKVLSA